MDWPLLPEPYSYQKASIIDTLARAPLVPSLDVAALSPRPDAVKMGKRFFSGHPATLQRTQWLLPSSLTPVLCAEL